AMGDPHPPLRPPHGLGAEPVASQAVVLVHAPPRAVGSSNSRRVLATVLERGEGLIQLARNILVADDSDDAAHDGDLRRPNGRGWGWKAVAAAPRTPAAPGQRERAATR